MRIAANLAWLFTDLPALDRPTAAQAAGFDGAEVLSPYSHTPADWQRALAGLPVCLINTPAHGPALGCAALPGAEAQFRADLKHALDYGAAMGAGIIHILAGKAAGRDAALTYRRNLDWAATRAPGQVFSIEPLNPQDMPGYFLNDFDQAAQVLTDVGAPNLGLQFDIWHAQRIHGDPLALWQRHSTVVNHVQVAGLAARAEPVAGELRPVIGAMRAAGYAGWIAAEYAPAGGTTAALGWLADLRCL